MKSLNNKCFERGYHNNQQISSNSGRIALSDKVNKTEEWVRALSGPVTRVPPEATEMTVDSSDGDSRPIPEMNLFQIAPDSLYLLRVGPGYRADKVVLVVHRLMMVSVKAEPLVREPFIAVNVCAGTNMFLYYRDESRSTSILHVKQTNFLCAPTDHPKYPRS